jgi:hypothetical protein
MLQHVAGVGFGIDDDHVWLQLSNSFGEIEVGRKRGDDVIAGFQQTDAQSLAARRLRLERRIVVAFDGDRIDNNDT